MTAVPGKSAVSVMALFAPGPADLDLLPTGIVGFGKGPGGIITCLKLPWAVKQDRSATESGDQERRSILGQHLPGGSGC